MSSEQNMLSESFIQVLLEGNGLDCQDVSIGSVKQAIPSLVFENGQYEVIFQKENGFLMLRTFTSARRAANFLIRAARKNKEKAEVQVSVQSGEESPCSARQQSDTDADRQSDCQK